MGRKLKGWLWIWKASCVSMRDGEDFKAGYSVGNKVGTKVQ